MCFKSLCPDFRLGQDYLMLAYHMDRGVAKIPEGEIHGTDLVKWEPEDPIVENGYQEIRGMIICERLGGCDFDKKNVTEIVCPIFQKERIIQHKTITSTSLDHTINSTDVPMAR